MDRRVDITDVTTPQGVMFSYSVEWYEEVNQLEYQVEAQASTFQQ
jgi:hypothetical protein